MLEDRVQGRLSVHHRGFGFIDYKEPVIGSAFVPPRALNGFLTGDLVEVSLIDEEDGRQRAGDLKLLERKRHALFGEVTFKRSVAYIRPDPRIGNSDWLLHDAPRELEGGEWVVALVASEKMRFDRVVPRREAPLTCILVNWGVRTDFSGEVLAELQNPLMLDTSRRRDLRDIPTITIDAPHSRDLDDALAVLPTQADGAIRVLVSIADVDSMVSEGSAIDQEAHARMTSVYLPGYVIPMLPRKLSEDRLSLLPGHDRPALTVELRIDAQGDITSTDISRSLIRSHARLSYKQTAAYLDHGDGDGLSPEVQSTLRWLRAAAARISAVRGARGGVNLEREEVSLKLDPTSGAPLAVETYELLSSHRLVERLMVATNEAVAQWLSSRGLPAIYRVQDEPDAERVANLAEFAHNFGFETGFAGRLSPRALAAFEKQFETSTVAPQVRTVLRRVLGRARYALEPSPHFGLAAPLYLHFTSPIRRYADLVVHRVVKAHLEGAREQQTDDAKLQATAGEINEATGRARKAQTERQRCLIAQLLTQRLGERFRGSIIAVKPSRLVVQLMGLGVTGTVSMRDISGGPFRFDPARETYVSDTKQFVVGASINVIVEETDEILGQVVLKLVD